MVVVCKGNFSKIERAMCLFVVYLDEPFKAHFGRFILFFVKKILGLGKNIRPFCLVFCVPKNPNVKRVLVIGSGPIVIGQAAEFDYAGTQACRSLKEEGMEVILVNSNPATIMTDRNIADKVYIEPLTARVLCPERTLPG